jgi:N-sulfoglucosamine sulfohydrolase
MADRPNIVYIHSHDTGRYIQPHGHAIPTPALQKLAEQGTLFRQAFTACPTCSPSRAALLTGMAPHSCGMLGLAHRGHHLNDYSQHILHTLRKVGYHSALCGVQHIAGHDVGGAEAIGYDEIISTGSQAVKMGPLAAKWLAEDRPKDKPFFLAVGFGDTHREFSEPGPDEDERYGMPPAPLPDTPETRRDMACYKASARELDAGYGMVFDALDEAGLADNTLIIATTDHGVAFPGMKCNLTDHGMGVFLIMRGPTQGEGALFNGGKVVDALVSQIDLFPTVCELTGAPKPDWLQGTSIMPVMRGETDQVNEQVFSEVTYHAALEPKRCVRTTRYKYIRLYGPRLEPVMSNCDNSISKKLWFDHGWADTKQPREQLYDLMFDPHETHNLADDPRHAEALADMRGRLDQWMNRTDDILLRDEYPVLPGLKNTPSDVYSPGEGIYITE